MKNNQIPVVMTAEFVTGACLLTRTRYATGDPALLLERGGERLAVVSVNLEHDIGLMPGEYAIKGWSENAGIPESLIEQGVLVDTGKRVKTGYVQAMVCTLIGL